MEDVSMCLRIINFFNLDCVLLRELLMQHTLGPNVRVKILEAQYGPLCLRESPGKSQ